MMREKRKVEASKKVFGEKDNKLLVVIQNILFTELAIAFNTTSDEIHEKVSSFLDENE